MRGEFVAFFCYSHFLFYTLSYKTDRMTTAILRGYKYRLSTRNSQIPFLTKHFGATRFMYNYLLDLRKKSCDRGIRLPRHDAQQNFFSYTFSFRMAPVQQNNPRTAYIFGRT